MLFYNNKYRCISLPLTSFQLLLYLAYRYVIQNLLSILIFITFLFVYFFPQISLASSNDNSLQGSASAFEYKNISDTELLKQAKSLRYVNKQQSTDLATRALNKAEQNKNLSVRAQSHNLLAKLAKESNQIEQSLHHFLQASVLFKSINDNRSHIMATVSYCEILVSEKRYIQADIIIDELLSFAQEYKDVSLIALTLTTKGDAYYQQKQYEDAITQYTNALNYLLDSDKALKKQLGETYKKIAQSYKRKKDAEKTAYFYKKALNVYTDLGNKKLMARTLNTIAEAERSLGNLVVALEYSIRSIEIYNQIDDAKGKAKALGVAGIIYRLIGRYEKSLEHIYETHLYYKKINNYDGIAESSNQMGLLYTRLKQFDQARSFYQLTIDLPEDKIELSTLASALRELSVIDVKEGNYVSAMQMVKRAKQIYQQENEITKESITARIIANIYSAQGDEDKAIASYRESLALASNTSQIYRIKAQTALAVSLINNHTDEAVKLLENSLVLSLRVDNNEQTFFAYRALRRAERLRGNIDESLDYAEKEIHLLEVIQNEKENNKLVRAKASLHSHKLETELQILKKKAKYDKLELEKKNNEIEIAEQANTIHELERIKNKYATIALTALLAVCIFLVIYIYRRFSASRKQNVKLGYLATHDPLTNCYNRRVLFEYMNRDFADKVLLGEYCVIMIDIDHFKAVNDTYGHGTGDTILREISKILQNSVRKNDIAARYGGEEFCIVLPGAGEKQAKIIAENIRKKVESSSFEGVKVTCSFGVSSIHNKAESPEGLINQADIALYKSKSGGRNQVTIWDESLN